MKDRSRLFRAFVTKFVGRKGMIRDVKSEMLLRFHGSAEVIPEGTGIMAADIG